MKLMIAYKISQEKKEANKLLHSDPNSTSLLCYSRYRSILAQQSG